MSNILTLPAFKILMDAAHIQGTILKAEWKHITRESAPNISYYITFIVAEILRSYLDAEKDNTIEELLEVVENHVASWIRED